MQNRLVKILSSLLAVCLLLTAAPLSGFTALDLFPLRASAVSSGSCGANGDNVTWTLDASGTLTISGSGKMKDYGVLPSVSAPWYSYSSSVKTVVIKSGVTCIGSYAFFCLNSLTNITISNSIISIGNGAFWECSITDVVIPYGVTSIGDDAFYGCISLTDITIPNSVKNIGSAAFGSCCSLTNITIPNSVIGIADYAFFGCSSLIDITIPNSVKTIPDYAFCDCISLTDITIPESVIRIGKSAFIGCSSLTNVTIPDSVKDIGNFSFHDCSSLASVVIPSSVTNIGIYSFYNCSSLTSIVISDSVTSIGEKSFYGCSSLKSVKIGAGVKSIGFEAFYQCSSLSSITIPDGVTYIGGAAFDKCPSLSSIAIPDSVTYISLSAFSACSLLDEVYYSGTREQWERIKIENYNTPLVNATIHFESAPPEIPENPDCSKHLDWRVQYNDTAYYTNSVFFGVGGFISDALEVYIELTNAVLIPVGDSDGIIRNVTLAAAINDDTLSFKKDAMAQTYSVAFDEILCGETACELLRLFPQANFSGEEKTVTVTLTLTAQGLETVTETCPLQIRKMPDDSVQEHMDFYNKDVVFRSSMRNYFGHEAALLAADQEYLWSRISTFDIDNYYKIVVADLITGMLQAQQFSLPNLIPEAVKNWTENLKTLKNGLKTIINDDYTGQFDLSETDLDKFLDTVINGSKYSNQGPTKEKDLFQFLLKRIESAEGQEKLRKVFSAADKTSQIQGMIKFGKNVVEDCLDCVTKITLFETFYDADEEFRAVIELVRKKASESGQTELVKAFDEYLRFDPVNDSTMLSYLPTILETSGKITQDAFQSIIGKKMIDYIDAKTLVWVGKNTILASGKALNTLAGFSTFSSAMGGAFLGVELGLCLSDILCDSDSLSKEMAMAVHMGELSTLLVQTLAEMEIELIKNKDSTSLRKFEYAFRLHKSAQIYIMDHLVEAMKAKRYSFLSKLLGKQRSMQEDIEALLIQKNQIEKMTCHKDVENSSHPVDIMKIVYVHCPVDVLIRDKNGETALCIENDEIIAQEEGTLCVILEGEKYILLPGNTEYSIQITATDDGQMRYSVREYKDTELHAVYENNEIPLRKKEVFIGNITDGAAEDKDSYDLYTDNICIPVEKTEISAFTPGDVDHDGEVTASDARLALRKSVNLEDFAEGSAEYLACDVDHDGKVTASDARSILRAAVGLEELK